MSNTKCLNCEARCWGKFCDWLCEYGYKTKQNRALATEPSYKLRAPKD